MNDHNFYSDIKFLSDQIKVHWKKKKKSVLPLRRRRVYYYFFFKFIMQVNICDSQFFLNYQSLISTLLRVGFHLWLSSSPSLLLLLLSLFFPLFVSPILVRVLFASLRLSLSLSEQRCSRGRSSASFRHHASSPWFFFLSLRFFLCGAKLSGTLMRCCTGSQFFKTHRIIAVAGCKGFSFGRLMIRLLDKPRKWAR